MSLSDIDRDKARSTVEDKPRRCVNCLCWTETDPNEGKYLDDEWHCEACVELIMEGQ